MVFLTDILEKASIYIAIDTKKNHKKDGQQMTALGIATDFAGEQCSTEEIKQALQQIKTAGFTHIHWCSEWRSDYQYSIYEIQQIKEWMDELHLQAKSLHASRGSMVDTVIRMARGARRDYMSFEEANRKAGVEIVRNRMQMAQMLGAKEIVLHMNLPYMTFQEEPGSEEKFYKQVFRSLDEVQEEAYKLQIKICIENMLETPEKEQTEQFDRLFDRYDKAFLGMCLDTGHANIILGEAMYPFIKRYQDRIFSVHINDNQGGPANGVYGNELGAWPCDLHQIPEEGTIDWKSMMQVLGASAYELPLVLELNSAKEAPEQFLKKAYEAGQRLNQYILR